MIALSIALSFIGLLAFVGFVLHLRRDLDKRGLALQCERAMDRVLDLTTRLEETREALDVTASALDKLKGVHNTSLAETGKALADLVSRVRGCELKAGIRGFTRQPESNLPPEVQG